MKSAEANYRITNREQQVLQLLADGISSQSICDQLMIDEETLRSDLKKLYTKFGVKNVNEAVVVGVREKLVTCQFIAYGD
jgi:DNA-binding CsgD family transcriptional regulator